MLRYIYEHHDAVAQFVAMLVPDCEDGFGRCKAIGVIDPAGKLIAGIVYHNWQPRVGIIEITGAALPKSKWLTRETIWRMYEYPFIHIGGIQMVQSLVPADDERVQRQFGAGGYMFTRLPRIFGRERDGIVCQFTREAWEESKIIRRAKPQEPPAIEKAA